MCINNPKDNDLLLKILLNRNIYKIMLSAKTKQNT